jgi:hypothetical protein
VQNAILEITPLLLILGGFNIQGDDGPTQMVERILSMLNQYLISNQTLELNNTFKVYVKILSIQHMATKERENRQHKKRTKAFYQRKKHYGANPKSKKFNYFWSLDVPNSFAGEPYDNYFQKKCLLICTILGILQNEFLCNINNKFVVIQKWINSVNQKKQQKAAYIIIEELNKVIDLTNLPNNGPYDLEPTCIILSNLFKCQFIIFNGISNSSKLLYMYPSSYNDELKPIYIYQPNSLKNHLVYIKHLSSFFKGNFRICFCCFKTFHARISSQPWHLCPKRPTCFACRRFYKTNLTFINSNLDKKNCDRYTTLEKSFLCPICNVTIFSLHCFSGHKRFCCGKEGNFGYFCILCKKFTYRSGKNTTQVLKKIHKCNNSKPCSICFQPIDENEKHLCLLKKEVFPHNSPKLAFISFHELMENNELIPCFIFILREEEKRGLFTKHTLSDECLNIENCSEKEYFSKKYFLKEEKYSFPKKINMTDDFKINFEILF